MIGHTAIFTKISISTSHKIHFEVDQNSFSSHLRWLGIQHSPPNLVIRYFFSQISTKIGDRNACHFLQIAFWRPRNYLGNLQCLTTLSTNNMKLNRPKSPGTGPIFFKMSISISHKSARTSLKFTRSCLKLIFQPSAMTEHTIQSPKVILKILFVTNID